MKKTKGTRKSGYLQREQFYYPAHNFIDVSVPSFDYAIPRFFFGYLAAVIFCKHNRDYLLSVLLKVGAPLCLIPMRVHVCNCSNRAKKCQQGAKNMWHRGHFFARRENVVKVRYQAFLLYAKM